MAHWRDGGIGNMLGSDDRPIKEWTLLEKLNELASTPMGAPIPRCLGGSTNIALPMSKIASEAFDEIQRLRAEVTRLDAALESTEKQMDGG